MMKWRILIIVDSGKEIGEEHRWIDYDTKEDATQTRDRILNNGAVLVSKESGGSRGWPSSSVKYVDMFPVKDEDGDEPTSDSEDA